MEEARLEWRVRRGTRLKEASSSGRYDEASTTPRDRAVTLQASTTTRGRSLAATLLSVLAVLASLVVGPTAATAQAGAASAATTSTVRGVPPLAFGPRETGDHLRALLRRGAGEQSRLAIAIERPAAAGHGSTFAAILGASVLVAPLVAGFLAFRERTGQVSRRMSGARRDRAPPALALV